MQKLYYVDLSTTDFHRIDNIKFTCHVRKRQFLLFLATRVTFDVFS